LKGEDILEAGSGSGRFTEHLIKTKANIYSFDISQAVEANFNNNKSNQNLKLFQADIYNIPLDKKFDKILCFGVLQHCPDVKKSFLNLTKYLKPGGEIVVDFYYRSWKRFYSPMFYLRFLTCRIKPSLLYKIIKFYVKFTWPLTRLLNKIPFIGPRIIFLMCIIDHTNKDIDYKGQKIKNDKLLKDWAILNTFDLLSARYENNQKKSEVRKMAQEAKLKNIKIFYGPNGICLRGQKQ
jgi:SAM-dependent methyltransferase